MSYENSEVERFTFIVLTPEHHFTQDVYMKRHFADKHFDALIEKHPDSCIAYYCASVGGQVNCYRSV